MNGVLDRETNMEACISEIVKYEICVKNKDKKQCIKEKEQINRCFKSVYELHKDFVY